MGVHAVALNQIQPGLRALVHNSIQPAKVQLAIPPGDTLIVSDEVAAQLQAANTHFVDANAPAPAAPAAPADVADEDASEVSPDATEAQAPTTKTRKPKD
jgi:hypothetical protein